MSSSVDCGEGETERASLRAAPSAVLVSLCSRVCVCSVRKPTSTTRRALCNTDMALGMKESLILSRLSPERRARFYTWYTACATFKFGLIVLLCGITVAAHGKSTACIQFHLWSLIPIGLVLTVISFLACYRMLDDRDYSDRFSWFFLFAFFTLLALFVAIIFFYVAFGGKVILNDDNVKPAHEYKLSDYKGWLRGRLEDQQYWATVSACLRNRHECEGMGHLVRDQKSGLLVPDSGAKMSPIQSGCCKPPSSCALTYVNSTMWTTTGAPAGVTDDDVDCSRWNSDQQTLCFQCDSCKAGVLEDIISAWGKVVGLLTFLMILYLCCCPCVVAATTK
ncbi:hypothetical protein ACP70R_015180 [Stipagrostis hirtigluma subsp. patula]